MPTNVIHFLEHAVSVLAAASVAIGSAVLFAQAQTMIPDVAGMISWVKDIGLAGALVWYLWHVNSRLLPELDRQNKQFVTEVMDRYEKRISSWQETLAKHGIEGHDKE